MSIYTSIYLYIYTYIYICMLLRAAVERIWHMSDGQGQILAITFRPKCLEVVAISLDS